MRYAWIDTQRTEYGLDKMCRALDISESGCRAWKRGGEPERKRLRDSQMLVLIQSVHAEFKGAYGSPRMVREMRERGFPASKERVEWLMRENGIRARHKTAFQGYNGFQAQSAGGTQPAGSQLHTGSTESGLDIRHHLFVDKRRLAVSGHRA
jgi:transposase InsO family protein